MSESTWAMAKPEKRLMQAWISRETWTAKEAILLSLGISPTGKAASEYLQEHQAHLKQAKREGILRRRPNEWLLWGEKKGLPYHTDWWLALTPERPIGFDGEHFAFLRTEMLSDAYLHQERKLITKWAKKPYWTSREAIDLSMNFEPFKKGWRGNSPETGETIEERDNRLQIFERAVEAGDLSRKATPKEYIGWLDQVGYYVSEAWKRAVGIPTASTEMDQSEAISLELEGLRLEVKEKSERIEALESAAFSDSAVARTEEIEELRRQNEQLRANLDIPNNRTAMIRRIQSLQKALLGAAVDGYSYDPRSAKSDAARCISEASNLLGCPVTSQTISTHLKESAQEHVDQTTWDVIFPRK